MATPNRTRSRSRSPLRTRGGAIFNEGELRRPNKDGEGGGGGGGGGGGQRGLSRHSDKMVYISNLPYEMSWMELKDLCRDKAGEVNFVETLEDRTGKSKGSAVVEFKTREGADKCAETIHRLEIKGRLVVAKKIRDPVAFFRKVKEDTGLDFLGLGDRQGVTRDRGPPPNAPNGLGDANTFGLSMAFLDSLNIKTPLVNRVFIANISYNCGVGKLFDICSMAGKIVWLDLQLDQDGRSRGMAVVEYSHPIEAVQAISMLHNQRIYDRTVSVKMDRFDKEDTRRREGELPGGLRGVGMGLGANGAPLANVASVIGGGGGGGGSSLYQHSPHLPLNGNSVAAAAPVVAINPFGGGASVQPFAVNQAQIAPAMQPQPAAVFQPQPSNIFGGEPLQNAAAVAFQQNPQLAAGYPAQYPQGGVPQQSLYSNAQSAMGQGATPVQMMGQSVTPSSTGVFGVKQDYGATSGGGGASGGAAFAPASGGSAGYDSSLSQPSTRVILIKNLPHDYTWTIVSDRLQQFGELEHVEMVSQGVAKVRFHRVPDAERAKATLQGTTVEGRVIGTEFL